MDNYEDWNSCNDICGSGNTEITDVSRGGNGKRWARYTVDTADADANGYIYFADSYGEVVTVGNDVNKQKCGANPNGWGACGFHRLRVAIDGSGIKPLPQRFVSFLCAGVFSSSAAVA